MTDKDERNEEEVKEKAMRYLTKVKDNRFTIEGGLEKLSRLKGEFKAIENELRSSIGRLEEEGDEVELEEIEDLLDIIGEEIEDKSRILGENNEEEYLKRLQYLQADFENYKKRSKREIEEIKIFANEDLIVKLLDVVDNFERALSDTAEKDDPLIKGVEMTYKQLRDILERKGVKPIDALGERFDPHKHEVVMVTEDGDHQDEEIIDELQRGYMLGDRVIRYSKVIIAKNA
jgi:molecular chaperone GrpE